MITLITGAPGAGKTAALVDMLTTIGKGRPIYVDGIPDLELPEVDISPLGDPHEWHSTVPDGSVIVIDEVQRVWRPRAPGSRVPPDIEALETHRHKGIDVYIITQGPNLVDRNVRTLVGRHVHLRDVGVLGRYWYEWPEVCEQPGTGYRSAPIKRRYRLPRRVFGRYRSASVHIKPVRRVPPALVITAVAVVGASVLGWRAVSSIGNRSMNEAASATASVTAVAPVGADSIAQSPMSSRSLVAGSAYSLSSSSPAAIDDMTAWLPRVSRFPESAPAYDNVRQVKTFPRVSAAVCMGKVCKCYTQQGTDAGLSRDDCRAWLESPRFDPYLDEREQAVPAFLTSPAVVDPAAAQVAPADKPASAPDRPLMTFDKPSPAIPARLDR